MFFNLPTLLTWARIVAIPLIVGLFYLQLEPGLQNLLATVLFVVVALTDWLDGYLARKQNLVSVFGKFMDPLADKLLVMASLVWLAYLGRLPLPGVIAGSMLVFIPAVGDFINADYLGSTQTTMIGNVIQKQFLVVKDYPAAAALSFVLMAMILVGVLSYARALGTEDLV